MWQFFKTIRIWEFESVCQFDWREKMSVYWLLRKRNICDFKLDFCEDLSMGLPTNFRPFCGGQFEANFWPILWTILAANLRPISSLLWWPTWGWFLAHCGGQFEDYFWPISGPLWQQFEVDFRPISGLFYGPLWRPISGQFLVAMALLQCVLEVLCHPDWRLITTRFWRDTAIAVVKLVLEVRRESEFGGTSRRHRQARVGGSSIAIFGGSSVIAEFGGTSPSPCEWELLSPSEEEGALPSLRCCQISSIIKLFCALYPLWLYYVQDSLMVLVANWCNLQSLGQATNADYICWWPEALSHSWMFSSTMQKDVYTWQPHYSGLIWPYCYALGPAHVMICSVFPLTWWK